MAAIFHDVAPGMEIEPNDRAVDANVLGLDQPISGFIGHAGDEDWYRIEIPLPDGGVAPPLDGGSNIVSIALSAWPFSFPRSRYDRLTPTQKAKIEGRIEEMLATFEASAPKKSRRK